MSHSCVCVWMTASVRCATLRNSEAKQNDLLCGTELLRSLASRTCTLPAAAMVEGRQAHTRGPA